MWDGSAARVCPLLGGCRLLTEPKQRWEEAGELGYALGRRDATVTSLDLLIATTWRRLEGRASRYF